MKYQRSKLCWFILASTSLGSALLAQQPAEQKPADQQPVPTAPAPAQPKPGNGIQWQVGDTTVKIGGYVKLDLIHDFDPIGSLNSFDPRTIPTNGLDGV